MKQIIFILALFYFIIYNLDYAKCENINITQATDMNCYDTCHNGVCDNNSTCVCNKYYITYHSSNMPGLSKCNYRQVSKLKAFLFSFLLGPTAMDLLYMGYIDNATAKLLTPLFIILISIIMFFIGKRQDRLKLIVASKICELVATITIIIWWMADWISILNNTYTDFNGIKLYNDL
jgi:hypothetical protein